MTKVINLRKYTKPKIRNQKKEFSKFEKNNLYEEKYKIIISLFSIVSIFLGALLFKNNNSYGVDYFKEIISILQTSSILNIFLNLIKFDIYFFILIFFIGTSFIGKILVIIPPALKCILIGYLSSFMYCEYNTKGIMFCLILLYPFFAITTTTLIFAANESAFMSNHIYNVVTNKNTADGMSIKLYLIRYLILIGVNIVCVILNSFIISAIAPKINLA